MPILLSEQPGQSRILQDSEDVIQALTSSGKLGPTLPYVETHPIQVVGPNVTPQGEVLPRIVAEVSASTDMTLQALSNRFMSLLPTISSLPPWSDDITERLGPEIYDRMAKDAEVTASLDMLVAASTSQDIRFVPSVSDGEPGHEEAKRIADFFTWMIQDYMTEQSFDEVRTASVSSALKYGNNITEMTYGVVPSGKWRNHVAVQSMRDAEPREYSIVVDNFNNVMGVIPAVNRYGIGGHTEQFIGTFINDPSKITLSDLQSEAPEKKKLVDYFKNALIPRRKFAIYTWKPTKNDPRGTSALRGAYSPWWLKQQIVNEMLSWLEKFSQPSIVGVTPEGAQEQCEYDAAGNITSRISPTNQLLTQLQKFQNSSAIAVPFGTSINMLQATGQGQVFLQVLAYANQEIARAILKQHLATSEGIHQSRAASTVHQDILSLVVIAIKNWQKRVIMQDFVKPLVELNFGYDSLPLAPKLDIGDGDGFPLNPFEVSQLQGVQWFSPSQFAEIDALLGLPVRRESPEEILAHFGGSMQEDEATFDEPGAAGDPTTIEGEDNGSTN